MSRILALLLAVLIALPASYARAAPFRAPHRAGAEARWTGFAVRGADGPLGGVGRTWGRFGRAAKIGLVIGSILVGSVAYHLEGLRSLTIPLAFSEMSQVEDDARAAGVEIDPLQIALMRNNDALMKVFEAHNLATTQLRLGDSATRFARELQLKLTLRKHRRELPELFRELPMQIDRARTSLAPTAEVAASLRGTVPLLESTWQHSTHHNTRLELKSRSVTVSDGKGGTTTKSESYFEEEYVSTDHTFRYDQRRGEQASSALSALRLKVPRLGRLALRTTSATNAEGEHAADVSRGRGAGGKPRLSGDELLRIANTWASGSTYAQNVDHLVQLWNETLAEDGRTWATLKATAKTVTYQTRSRTDDGPAGVQAVQAAAMNSHDFVETAEKILGSLDHTQRTMPVLEAKIRQLVARELEGSGVGNSHQLATEIMKLSREIYRLNFAKGVDVKAFRAWVVLLAVLAGAAVGSGAGLAVTPLRRRLQGNRTAE